MLQSATTSTFTVPQNSVLDGFIYQVVREFLVHHPVKNNRKKGLSQMLRDTGKNLDYLTH